MKAVIQRVLDANLKVDGKLISEIGFGYVIFLGVMHGDEQKDADYMIRKIPSLPSLHLVFFSIFPLP